MDHRPQGLVPASASTLKLMANGSRLTCTNDPLNGDEGDVDLLGELVHRLVGVLIGQRVDVGPHARELDCRKGRVSSFFLKKSCGGSKIDLVSTHVQFEFAFFPSCVSYLRNY